MLQNSDETCRRSVAGPGLQGAAASCPHASHAVPAERAVPQANGPRGASLRLATSFSRSLDFTRARKLAMAGLDVRIETPGGEGAVVSWLGLREFLVSFTEGGERRTYRRAIESRSRPAGGGLRRPAPSHGCLGGGGVAWRPPPPPPPPPRSNRPPCLFSLLQQILGIEPPAGGRRQRPGDD